MASLILCSCLTGDGEVEDDTLVVTRYVGSRNCLGQRHGHGTYMFHNGDVYEGMWKFNNMHGYGVYRYVSGQKDEGFFRWGRFVGTHIVTETVGEYVKPLPTPKTACDLKQEAYERQKRVEHAERKRKFDEQRAERKKKREEFARKYPSKRHTKKYGTIQVK